MVGAKYSDDGREAAIKGVVGNKTLADLGKTVVITSFLLDNKNFVADDPDRLRTWEPKIWHNCVGNEDNDGTALAWELAMMTSAAPTYFPAFKGYVDGGVFANNPAMIALAQSQDRRNSADLIPALGDIRLLSMGTGRVGHYIDNPSANYGLAQWAKPITSLMIDGMEGIADFQCRVLLPKNHYQRIDPAFPLNVAGDMDDPGLLNAFATIAASYIRSDSRFAQLVEWARVEWMR